MSPDEVERLDWAKGDGLLPAIVQDARTGSVLMLGFMNREALETTFSTGRVTFWSRTRGRLWTKGETSGNYVEVDSVTMDCDRDTLLVIGRPVGPVCHTGAPDCFPGHPVTAATELAFLRKLEGIIESRVAGAPDRSYTAKLYAEGPMRMAQKVGEEGLEVALAAVGASNSELVGEAADLVFHLLLLLKSRGLALHDVIRELESRHAARN
jgi:phosphoribosyl-ATP pyrophosphohydrolase/phosphoribosyl-AMP cyclohydrolase